MCGVVLDNICVLLCCCLMSNQFKCIPNNTSRLVEGQKKQTAALKLKIFMWHVLPPKKERVRLRRIQILYEFLRSPTYLLSPPLTK
jgi:hypothetical protein